MRSLHYILMACAASVLVGCATTTTEEDLDARGTAPDDPETYQGTTTEQRVYGHPGVNTNYFGPVTSGAEAARGPGTPSGQFDDRP